METLSRGRGYLVKGDKEGEKIPVTNLSLKDGMIKESAATETVGAEKGRLLPQEIGMIVTDYLVEHFPEVLDYDFTAKVEKGFDEIAEGELAWNSLISNFYAPFHKCVETVLEDRQYNHVERTLGTDPADGKPITARFGQYGPYIQKGEGEDRQFARLAPGQLIESITLEEALKLFKLPRTVGRFEDEDIIATKGPYGPYLKYGKRNVSLPRGTDPLKVDLDTCIALIREDSKKPAAGEPLKQFGDISVLSGKYGPYIKFGGSNYKIPKGTDAGTLTEEACKAIIEEGKPTGKSGGRFRKFRKTK